ncbi:hypothetical protein Dda_1223 [Drechslerella dactyloides]|uniref:CFEM domain-containing protein n=1 Tax=Drechslerella dactyloides TaxID=74499 RepID=A0AAD6J5S8_DREDA|nr:hypothetical protein Dda_1223 [Drechslerella dactyloides]
MHTAADPVLGTFPARPIKRADLSGQGSLLDDGWPAGRPDIAAYQTRSSPNYPTMYAKFATLALLAAAPALTAAQENTGTGSMLPSCLTTCYGLAVARASCDTLSPSCICGSNTFFNFVSNCLTTGEYTCTETEAVDIWNKLQAQCADKLSSALPSLKFRTSESSISATIGSILPDTTTGAESISVTMGTITRPGNFTVAPTMGTVTGPSETSEDNVSTVTRSSAITGPGQPSASGTQVSQTTRSPSAPTQSPNDAMNLIPSIVSLIIGSFMAGGALFFML